MLPLLLAGNAAAQSLVTEIKIRTDPEDAKIRPLDEMAVQVVAYGEVTDAAGKTEKVRLQEAGAKVTIKEENGGWLSKPFRFPGQETEPFYQRPDAGLAAIIFRRAQGDYVLQDAVLYTAPEQTGKYHIEADLNGKTASLTIEVDTNAPARRVAEETYFAREAPSSDPYRRLVEHYAPFIAQETWFQPKSDYLARFDLDGDWEGDNNWDDAEKGSSQAYVHYAVMETQTHWFLIYNFFHPRDYSDKCVVGTCHENDNEGLILTVEKDGSAMGHLLTMETLAHNNIYSYVNDRRVRSNLHNPDGQMELHEGSHPVIFIESGGHGVFGSTDPHAHYSPGNDAFADGTGVTYRYKGVAEKPKHANDRNVGYELLPIYDYWWTKANQGNANRTFDAYFRYTPYGNRPGVPFDQIAGSFLGRKFSSNSAKPFWGWHDNRTAKRQVLAPGQWALDPAYGVSVDLRMPEPFSLTYLFNPYLGIGNATPQIMSGPSAAPPPATVSSSGTSPSLTGTMGEFRARLSGGQDAGSKRGSFDVRLVIDGEALVYVQGSTIRYESVSGRPPANEGSEYSQELPRAHFTRFTLSKRDGRGEVELLEQPSAANDYTAKLRFSDPKGGDDHYQARLEWEWDTLAEPDPQPTGILSRHMEVLGEAGNASIQRGSSTPPGTELRSGTNDPSEYSNSSSGAFEFWGRVDGTVILRIQGDRVYAENTSGRPVELEKFAFSQPVPGSRVGKMELDKRDGRGQAVLLERPWEENGFQAVIQISDPSGGDDNYHLVLRWER
jgi:hypothetical protein